MRFGKYHVSTKVTCCCPDGSRDSSCTTAPSHVLPWGDNTVVSKVLLVSSGSLRASGKSLVNASTGIAMDLLPIVPKNTSPLTWLDINGFSEQRLIPVTLSSAIGMFLLERKC